MRKGSLVIGFDANTQHTLERALKLTNGSPLNLLLVLSKCLSVLKRWKRRINYLCWPIRHRTTRKIIIRSLGHLMKFVAWVPHKLYLRNKEYHFTPRYTEIGEFHFLFVEACITLLTYICWDIRGVIGKELLWSNQIQTTEAHCGQLKDPKGALTEKSITLVNTGSFMFHAGHHIVVFTQREVAELFWQQLVQPMYSPYLALSDLYFICFLDNYLKFTELFWRRRSENQTYGIRFIQVIWLYKSEFYSYQTVDSI